MNKITKAIMIAKLKGRHSSPKTEFKKGCQIRLGAILSKKTRNKISRGNKGRVPWNKGIPVPQEIKDRISKTLTGHKTPLAQRIKLSKALKGKNAGQSNGNWKGGINYYGKYAKIVLPNGIYLNEHRYLMEKFLGRKLKSDEVVHHINRIRSDNRLENLIVMSKSAHSTYHNLAINKKISNILNSTQNSDRIAGLKSHL